MLSAILDFCTLVRYFIWSKPSIQLDLPETDGNSTTHQSLSFTIVAKHAAMSSE